MPGLLLSLPGHSQPPAACPRRGPSGDRPCRATHHLGLSARGIGGPRLRPTCSPSPPALGLVPRVRRSDLAVVATGLPDPAQPVDLGRHPRDQAPHGATAERGVARVGQVRGRSRRPRLLGSRALPAGYRPGPTDLANSQLRQIVGALLDRGVLRLRLDRCELGSRRPRRRLAPAERRGRGAHAAGQRDSHLRRHGYLARPRRSALIPHHQEDQMKKILLGAVAVAVVVAGCTAASHLGTLQPRPIPASPPLTLPETVKIRQPAFQRGIDVDAYTYPHHDFSAAAAAVVAYVKSLNANSLLISFPFFMSGKYSSHVFA